MIFSKWRKRWVDFGSTDTEEEYKKMNYKVRTKPVEDKKIICPFCKKEIIPESEDNRYDTERGTTGEINYFCPECNRDITEVVETAQYTEIEKKFLKKGDEK